MFAKTVLLIQPFLLAAHGATLPFNVSTVKAVMIKNAKSSWEFGTVAQALLELDNPDVSVFGAHPFATASPSMEGLAYAQKHITLNAPLLIANSYTNSDPASLGVFAVMIGKTDSAYTKAAELQRDTLLYHTPRASNGAISHRSHAVELWYRIFYASLLARIDI